MISESHGHFVKVMLGRDPFSYSKCDDSTILNRCSNAPTPWIPVMWNTVYRKYTWSQTNQLWKGAQALPYLSQSRYASIPSTTARFITGPKFLDQELTFNILSKNTLLVLLQVRHQCHGGSGAWSKYTHRMPYGSTAWRHAIYLRQMYPLACFW